MAVWRQGGVLAMSILSYKYTGNKTTKLENDKIVFSVFNCICGQTTVFPSFNRVEKYISNVG